LLYHIRLQADGRPGLAATLSHMCLAGDVRRAMTGEGLVDQLAPQINRMLDVQDATPLLAPFALGGDAGVRMERVAAQLGRPLDDVSSRLAQLAAAGVVMERRNRAVSVEPAPMRWVIVRRSFFGGAGSPSVAPFLNLVENPHSAIDTLIGAKARGASVPDLEMYLEQAGSDRLWESYASVGPAEARYAIRAHPQRVPAIAETALHHAPELVITLLLDRLSSLLDRLRDSGSDQLPDSENPLHILNRWATKIFPGNGDSIRRRSILMDTTMSWWQDRHDARTAVRVLCIALRPDFDFLAPDPGNQLKGRFDRGCLDQQDLRTLATFWPRVRKVVRDSRDVPWALLFNLAESWHRLHVNSLPAAEIAASPRSIGRKLVERMLADLTALSHDKPGVQTQLRELGRQFGVSIETTPGRDFEDLYPPDFMVENKLDEQVLDRWRGRKVDDIAVSMARVQTEARDAGLRYPPWVAYWLCSRLAEITHDPVVAAEAFMAQELPGEFIDPFLHRMVKDDLPQWAQIVRRCLRDDRYRKIGFKATLCHPAPPGQVLSAALATADDMAGVIEACFHQGLIPSTTIRAMLQCSDPCVAGPAAIGHWCAITQEGHDGALDDTWRRAILRAPVGKWRGSAHDDYWIGEIMSADTRLAEEWLLRHFGEKGDLHFWKVANAVARIVGTLDSECRMRVMMGLRADPWNGDLVKLLVGDDDGMYRKLFGVRGLECLHLAPLTGKPDGNAWRAKALLALGEGRSSDEIAEATLGTSRGWSGSESEMWAGWRRSFEALLGDVDHGIARIGERGVEIVKQEESRALADERYQAVHGRSMTRD